MKYKKGDKVRVRADLEVDKKYGSITLLAGRMEACRGKVGTVMSNSDKPYVAFPHLANSFFFSEEMLEPVQDGGVVKTEKYFNIGDIVSHPVYGTGRVISLNCDSVYNVYTDSYINKITYNVEFESGIEKVEPHFLTKHIFTLNKNKSCQVSFESSAINLEALINPNIDIVTNEEQAKKLAEQIEEKLRGGHIGFKNGSKIEKENDEMRLMFTTTEGYRIDKTNNGRIPTITTHVTVINRAGMFRGEATCDKMEYDEREGVLNACANALLGSFDREYNNEVKRQAKRDLHSRTCKTCHQVFDTPEEARAHEKWHIENKKARRQRYLERKEARDRLAEMEREGRIEQYMKELAK